MISLQLASVTSTSFRVGASVYAQWKRAQPTA